VPLRTDCGRVDLPPQILDRERGGARRGWLSLRGLPTAAVPEAGHVADEDLVGAEGARWGIGLVGGLSTARVCSEPSRPNISAPEEPGNAAR
jgi:hypothetical protein